MGTLNERKRELEISESGGRLSDLYVVGVKREVDVLIRLSGDIESIKSGTFKTKDDEFFRSFARKCALA